MFKRQMEDELRAAADRMPVVMLTGPRQSGKTTLVRHVFPDHDYVSLERPDERSRAMSDPLGFLARFRRGVILDEVQRAPELLSYIQVDVDQEDLPGRFILTGSQNLLLMESVSQTLAGRTAVLRLLPLSLAELFGREPLRPERLDEATEVGEPPAREMWPTLWAGFYPRIHDRSLPPDSWLADYRRTYLERDLRDVLRVMDIDAFDRFMRLAAARTAQELNLTSLADDAGISQPTAKQWLTVLRVGYIVTLIPPHHENFRKRLRKRPKLHFLDTGLCCNLLGITNAQILENHPLRGSIFESFVASEIIKSFENSGRQAPLFHWRDASGHEIDLLLAFGDRLLPVEVKSGITVRSDSLNNLLWWLDLEKNPNTSGTLIHGGSQGYGFRGMTVRPWFLS